MSQWQVQQQVAKKDYSCMYQRIHCKPSWSFQQILSQTKEEMFMPVEESFTMHCTNWLSYSNEWI